jgi:hypothetical protein
MIIEFILQPLSDFLKKRIMQKLRIGKYALQVPYLIGMMCMPRLDSTTP